MTSWKDFKTPDFVPNPQTREPIRKYVFIKEYTIGHPETTSKQGVVTPATIIKQFKIGDIILGSKMITRGIINNEYIETTINGNTYSLMPNLVNEYLSSDEVAVNSNTQSNSIAKKETTTFLTTKNIVIGLVSIAAIFGILKVSKVI